MKMKFLIRILFTIYGLFVLNGLYSQDKKVHEISQEINRLVSDIRCLSDSLYGIDFQLINGEEYIYRHSGINGHPYYHDNSWIEGTVKTVDAEYSGVSLRYDIYDDLLILNHISSQGSFMISLNKAVVREFSLG